MIDEATVLLRKRASGPSVSAPIGTINGCAECTKQAATCTATLEPRYQRLFDNVAIHSTYMSFEREAPRERDGRMVIYGLTADEGDFICEQLRAKFQNHYTGKVECVHARRD